MKLEPYKERDIKDLNREEIMVSISGTVVNKGESSFILDDGTGQISVMADNIDKVAGYVRVFGRVIPYEDNIQVKADAVQDLSNIDKLLYKKTKDILK